jgi:hypothetical protein
MARKKNERGILALAQLPADDKPATPEQSAEMLWEYFLKPMMVPHSIVPFRTALLPEPPVAPVPRLSGKKWVPIAFDRRRDELLAMNITDASLVLEKESETAPDCAKPVKHRYIEKLLRDLSVWPKACRNSSKQRPK